MAISQHPQQAQCLKWFQKIETFATCSVTEGTFLRILMQQAEQNTAIAAWNALEAFRAHPKHVFWADDFSYSEVSPTRLTGHRQITDSWLAELTKRKAGKLATLDDALSVLWPDSTFLIPV